MRKSIKILLLFIFSLLLSNDSYTQQKVKEWDRFELSFHYTQNGNGYTDVELSAIFKSKDTSIVVSGFYDGGNTFKIRFMPIETGTWNYTTSSNIADLNNKKGSFECIRAADDNHGMVKVSNKYDFKFADGKQYYPFGTTVYAWIHMTQELQELTLQTLKKSGFNKVRMCVLPKAYGPNKTGPELFPFQIKKVEKDSDGNEIKVWDYTHLNPAFFQHIEKRIDDLKDLGIEADLILFHPYDEGIWGFDKMPMSANIMYVKYLVSRFASFSNVWWSLANEWDLIKSISHTDWDTLSKIVVESDPYRHLCSIHGTTAKYFEYWKPWFTHVSIQDEAPVMYFGSASILRNALHKPIIYDEVGYEGNFKGRWGRYSPEEMTYLFWMGVIAGTYVSHGETYNFPGEKNPIVWSNGGELKGTSWERISFLRNIIEDGPGPLQIADISRDNQTATAGDGYYIIYFGKEMNESWLFNLPVNNAAYERPKEGALYKVEIIDTWDMSIKEYPEIFEVTRPIDYRVFDKDFKKVRLPFKPYIALRIREIDK